MPQTVHPYYHSRLKRNFDILLSLVLLVGLSPLLMLIGLGVFITIGQPILFKQKRVGLNKQIFTMFKFRTMKPGAENLRTDYEHLNQAPYPMFKIFTDPRFVGIGKWLSQTGFDEFPQLINILRGEMSFIGPRPLPVNEAKLLKSDWNFRYEVKPGIFSYWTLSPDRHKSLAIWKKLDQKTLAKGGLQFELWLISQMVDNELLKLVGNK